jgi:hypothetical protein
LTDAGRQALFQFLTDVVEPVTSAMLEPKELEAVGIGFDVEARVVLDLVVAGETSQHFLWGPDWESETLADARTRLASELQDFIAESRFGWGQERTYVEA